MSNLKDEILSKLYSPYLSQKDLVQIFELAGDLLNTKTQSNFAKDKGLSYNGVWTHIKANDNILRKELFGVKFVFEED